MSLRSCGLRDLPQHVRRPLPLSSATPRQREMKDVPLGHVTAASAVAVDINPSLGLDITQHPPHEAKEAATQPSHELAEGFDQLQRFEQTEDEFQEVHGKAI